MTVSRNECPTGLDSARRTALQWAIMLTIDIETARRFILGKQGLWPGRRWRGLVGA